MKVLLNNGDADFTLDIPLSVEEITFEQFIDFTAKEQKFFESVESDKEPKAIDESIGHLIEAIGLLVAGDVEQLPFSADDDAEQLIQSNFMLSIDSIGQELTIIKLYAHCVNLISSYQPVIPPAEFNLEWNGIRYTINRNEAVRSLLNVPLTAGEVITTLELQRKTVNAIKKKGDPDGNLAFNLGLQEMAVLLRKPNERLPSNRRKRIDFIDERVKTFRHLPMDIVLDVRFFLISSMNEYLKTRLTSSSSTLQNVGVRQMQSVEQ